MSRNPIKRRMKGTPQDLLAAEGLMYQDWDAITPCQRSCASRLGIAVQREQESYMLKHPEISAMLKIFIAKMIQKGKRKDVDKEAALHFTRPIETLDDEIRTFLELPEDGPYVKMENQKLYEFEDEDFYKNLTELITEHYPPPPWDVRTPPGSPPPTKSSSFMSIITSDITLPTPEPIPTPEPTISQIFYTMISTTVDKVIYGQVNDEAILYDTAYVEVMKAVEEAMEIPVMEIKNDIATLFKDAFQMFEIAILEKERIAAEIAWDKRMRKKLKKTLRRQKNFKGYETPPSTSQVSSHESYKGPPPRHCECQPVPHYNRYGKDRFGIYLPRKTEFSKKTITTAPACSALDENQEDGDSKVSKSALTSTYQSTYTLVPEEREDCRIDLD